MYEQYWRMGNVQTPLWELCNCQSTRWTPTNNATSNLSQHCRINCSEKWNYVDQSSFYQGKTRMTFKRSWGSSMNRLTVQETKHVYERYLFNKRDQKLEESIDECIIELRRIATRCNFCECLNESDTWQDSAGHYRQWRKPYFRKQISPWLSVSSRVKRLKGQHSFFSI